MKEDQIKSGVVSKEEKPEQGRPRETRSDTRIPPEDVFATAEKKIFIEEGRWQFEFQDSLYSDVLKAAYLEGYIVTEIKHIEKDRIQIEVYELE